jgi:membrane-associated phospholipid phosphatase
MSHQILNTLSYYILEFTHEIVIVPLFLVGFLFLNRPQWGIALFLLFFSMIYNPALKSLFQVPLPLALGKAGYAFPSGHMQVAVMFYGWIFLTWPSKVIRYAIGGLLTLIGFALVYKGYHTPRDIFGAIGFGGIMVWVAYKMMGIQPFSSRPPLLGLALCVPSAGFLLYMKTREMLPVHSLYAFGGLMTFSILWLLGWMYVKPSHIPKIGIGRSTKSKGKRR